MVELKDDIRRSHDNASINTGRHVDDELTCQFGVNDLYVR